MKKKYFYYCILFSLFLSMGILINNIPIITQNIGDKETDANLYAAAPPFSITADGQFDTYDSGGNGNPGTPWIIADYVIDASGQGANGILIQDTTAYFIIQNCTIINADVGYSGIYCDNVINGEFKNNTLVNNSVSGIHLLDSNFNNITDNNASLNRGSGFKGGISLEGSSNNTITYNTANNNSAYGIILQASSRNNTVSHNIVNNNSGETGIKVNSFGHNNTFINNTVCFSDNGININDNSHDNVLINNTCDYNIWRGIFINYVDDVYAFNNSLSHNQYYGLVVRHCQNSVFENNTIQNMTGLSWGYGLYLTDTADNNNFTYNNIFNNTGYGVYIENSGSNRFTENFLRNNKASFYESGTSSGNIFLNNDVDDANTGANPGGSVSIPGFGGLIIIFALLGTCFMYLLVRKKSEVSLAKD